MIDVLVIAYNHAPYLPLAIESILAQDCPDAINRIIICDDASTDDSALVIEKLAARSPGKIIPILREQNLGLAKNFRLGLDYCYAPYIAILEGDDVWCARGKLSAQKAALDHYENLVAVAHDVTELDHAVINLSDLDRQLINGQEELVLLNDRALLNYAQFGFFPSTVMVRTAILKKCTRAEFDGLKTIDCAVHWLLGQQGDMGFFNYPWTIHGGHADSAYSKPNNLLAVYQIQVLLRLIPFLEEQYRIIAIQWLRYYSKIWLEQLNYPARLPEIELSYRYIAECGDMVLSQYFFGENGIVTLHEKGFTTESDDVSMEIIYQGLKFSSSLAKNKT